jgi:hypothetical protein
MRLHFTPGGRLIAAEGRMIQVWDLGARRHLQRLSGDLIGVDRLGRTLLLETPDGALQARDVDSGETLSLAAIDRARFSLAQRVRIQTGNKAAQVQDALTGTPIYQVPVEALADPATSGSPFCDQAVLPDDGQWLAVSISGDSAWGEWARGYCLGPNGRPRFELLLNHEAERPLLVASPGGRFLLAEHQPARYKLIDPADGETLTGFHLTDTRAGRFAALWDAGRSPRLVLHESERSVGVHTLGAEPRRMGALETPAAVEEAIFITADHLALLLETSVLMVYSLKAWRPIYNLDLRAA